MPEFMPVVAFAARDYSIDKSCVPSQYHFLSAYLRITAIYRLNFDYEDVV